MTIISNLDVIYIIMPFRINIYRADFISIYTSRVRRAFNGIYRVDSVVVWVIVISRIYSSSPPEGVVQILQSRGQSEVYRILMNAAVGVDMPISQNIRV